MRRPIPTTVPNWFEAWRRRNSLTKAGAALALDLHRNTVARYESGELEIPRVVALACSAISHGIPPMGRMD